MNFNQFDFCFHEYKIEEEPKGDLPVNVLVAMLAAQELDTNQGLGMA